MLDSPPPYTREPPLWMRFFNWVMPSLGVATDELRPDSEYVRRILTAASDIRLCEGIFDGWIAHLNRVTINSKKLDKRVQLLGFYLGVLRADAMRCSSATHAILRCHAQFAKLMAQRIDDASNSRFTGLNYDISETSRLANEISQASRELSTDVMRMRGDLTSFVSTLEEIKVTVRKEEQTLAGRIWGWLKSLFKALTRIFITLGPIISPFLHCVAPGVSGIVSVASTLSMAASTFCGSASEPHKRKEPESIESVLLFLKEIVPKEAQAAQRRLERFDEALPIMGLEAHMKTGRRVTLRGPDPGAVAKEWRNVAKKYQEA